MSDFPRTLRDGRYAVIGLLGEGTQGQTLDAVDKRDGRPVAIKRFVVRGARSWKDVELAEREARVLATLSHPSLPGYVDHFEEGGELYLVMAKIEGQSLALLRQQGVRLGRDEVVRFLQEFAALLDYLHGRAPPVFHRDIKPGNVIRRPDGSFALVDFGSVRDHLRAEGGSTVVGTFGYMAPEQFQGRALPQSDVYGVGATAICLLTGCDPEALPHQGLKVDVRRALGHDPELARVLDQLLEPDPDRRPTALGPVVAHLSRRPRAEGDSRGRARVAESETPVGAAQGPPALLIFVLFTLGLTIARVAVSIGVRAFVPLLLLVLSVFFGSGLRRAAQRVRAASERADGALVRALQVVRRAERSARSGQQRRHARRVRVQETPPVHEPRPEPSEHGVVDTTGESLEGDLDDSEPRRARYSGRR